jgi:hypothetical protein
MNCVTAFFADWARCCELDPAQHLLSAFCGFCVALLAWIFWASVRGYL